MAYLNQGKVVLPVRLGEKMHHLLKSLSKERHVSMTKLAERAIALFVESQGSLRLMKSNNLFTEKEKPTEVDDSPFFINYRKIED